MAPSCHSLISSPLIVPLLPYRNNGLWRTDMGHRLADLTALPDSLPLHQPHPSTTCTTLGSPLSLTSCTSGGEGPQLNYNTSRASVTHTHKHTCTHTHTHTHTHTVGSEIRAQAPPTRDCSKLVTRTHSLRLNVRDLKQDIATLKYDHATSLSDFQQTMMITGDRILAAIETYRKIGGVCVCGSVVCVWQCGVYVVCMCVHACSV